MGDNRENVFTQIARDINLFTEHKLTKVDLYENIISYLEMADESERSERSSYKITIDNLHKKNASPHEYFNLPYSNYDVGLKMIND
jgi:hypothetical protein